MKTEIRMRVTECEGPAVDVAILGEEGDTPDGLESAAMNASKIAGLLLADHSPVRHGEQPSSEWINRKD